MRLGAHKSRKSRDTRDLVPGRSPIWPRSRKKKGREGKDADKRGPAGSGKKGRRGARAGLLGWAGMGRALGDRLLGCGLRPRSGFFLYFILFSVFFSKNPFPNKILNANKFKLEANNTK